VTVARQGIGVAASGKSAELDRVAPGRKERRYRHQTAKMVTESTASPKSPHGLPTLRSSQDVSAGLSSRDGARRLCRCVRERTAQISHGRHGPWLYTLPTGICARTSWPSAVRRVGATGPHLQRHARGLQTTSADAGGRRVAQRRRSLNRRVGQGTGPPVRASRRQPVQETTADNGEISRPAIRSPSGRDKWPPHPKPRQRPPTQRDWTLPRTAPS